MVQPRFYPQIFKYVSVCICFVVSADGFYSIWQSMFCGVKSFQRHYFSLTCKKNWIQLPRAGDVWYFEKNICALALFRAFGLSRIPTPWRTGWLLQAREWLSCPGIETYLFEQAGLHASSFFYCPTDLKTKAVPAPKNVVGFKQGCAAVSKLSVSTMQCCHWQHAMTVSRYPAEESPCISFNGQLPDFGYFEINGTNFTLRN